MRRKDALIFLILSAIWGSSYMFIKVALHDGFGPLALVSMRLLAGALLMLVIARSQGQVLPTDRRILGYVAFLALINNVLPFSLIAWGEQYIDSGLAAILNSTTPFFAVIISHFALADERLTWQRAFGIIVGFLGVLVLFAPEVRFSAGGWVILGQIAIVLAALGYASGSVFTRRYLGGVRPASLTVLQLGFAFLWIVVPTLALEQPWRLHPTGLGWFSVLWLGFLGSGIAYLLFFILVRSIGAAPTTMVTYVIPLFAVLFGVVFLREKLAWWDGLGLALIFAGVWIVNRRQAGVSRQNAA